MIRQIAETIKGEIAREIRGLLLIAASAVMSLMLLYILELIMKPSVNHNSQNYQQHVDQYKRPRSAFPMVQDEKTMPARARYLAFENWLFGPVIATLVGILVGLRMTLSKYEYVLIGVGLIPLAISLGENGIMLFAVPVLGALSALIMNRRRAVNTVTASNNVL